MKIDLPNVCNARDIGGMKTKYGVIKQGKFIRSGVLNRLNGEDVEILKKYNLKRVIDLRTSMETETTPDVKIDGVEYLNVSVVRSVTFGISFESLDGPILAERLQAVTSVCKKGRRIPRTYGKHLPPIRLRRPLPQRVRYILKRLQTIPPTARHCGTALWVKTE